MDRGVRWSALGGDHEALRDAFTLQGLLGGWRIDGGTFSGVGGVFAGYDNLSGGVFRIAGSSVGGGVTGQFTFSPRLAVETTAVLSAVLMGAVDTTVVVPAHLYHLGPGGSLELEAKLYAGERTRFDVTARGYVIVGSSEAPGADVVNDVRAAALWRVWGPLALGVSSSLASRILENHRVAPAKQLVVTPSLDIAWLSDPRLGAWVPSGGR